MSLKSFFNEIIEALRTPILKEANYDRKTEVLTLTYDDGSINQYHGSCTCWNKYPNMEHCNIFLESELYRYWKYNQVHNKPFINPDYKGPKS